MTLQPRLAMNPKDSFFTLASGQNFWPFAPKKEDIHIKDIALALSNLCRFNGHCHRFYCVAEHSIHVSNSVPPEHALAGLLHDATEAYVGDMIRPIKKYIPAFEALEEGVWLAIADRFGLAVDLPPSVKYADDAVLKAEARDLLLPFGTPKFDFIVAEPPAGLSVFDPERGIEPMPPMVAEAAFLARFASLTG